MAEAAHGDHAHGHMDIKDQSDTFSGFLAVSVWGCGLIGMSVSLLVVAFAMNLGWMAGLVPYVLIGALVGLLFKQGGAWWAMLIGTTVLLAVGGGIVGFVTGLAG